jgi:hypothetical protein
MNPRAQAANDFTRGIKNNHASFNNIQALTEYDKKSLRWGYIYFSAITLVFGYFSLFSDATSVLKNQEFQY